MPKMSGRFKRPAASRRLFLDAAAEHAERACPFGRSGAALLELRGEALSILSGEGKEVR